MLGHAQLRRTIAGFGRFDDGRERVTGSTSRQWQGLGVVHGQVEQLGATGDAQLVENPKKVVLDRVWAELQSDRNFTVRHATGDVLNDLAFSGGKQFDAFVISRADERRIGQSFQGMIEIDAAGPDLPLMNAANAFAEALQSLFFRKNTPGASAKAFQHLPWLGGVQQDHTLDQRAERAHLPQDIDAMAGLVVQIVTDDGNVDGHSGNGSQQLLGIRSSGYDLEAAIIAQSVG